MNGNNRPKYNVLAERAFDAEDLQPSPPKRRRTRLEHARIKKELDERAFYIGKQRKLELLFQQIRELQRIVDDQGRIHSTRKSTPEEQFQDWKLALTYFAADVLSGRTSFSDQLGPESWSELANVPLDEVKRLDAYFIAAEHMRGADPVGCYLEACRSLSLSLLDPHLKHGWIDFVELRNFLTAGRGTVVNRACDDRSRQAIKERKAWLRYRHRLEHGEPGTAESDWKAACDFTRLYYDNILDAVEGREDRHRESMKKVLSAFGSPWREWGMVDCFEAAIAIYFFPPEEIKACRPGKGVEEDIL